MLYTYLAEFQPIKKRDLFLSWMETAWVMGMVIVACKYLNSRCIYVLLFFFYFFFYIVSFLSFQV